MKHDSCFICEFSESDDNKKSEGIAKKKLTGSLENNLHSFVLVYLHINVNQDLRDLL